MSIEDDRLRPRRSVDLIKAQEGENKRMLLSHYSPQYFTDSVPDSDLPLAACV